MNKKKLNNRQLLILFELTKQEYTTSKELASITNLSVRTIKSEIAILKKILIDDDVDIRSIPGKGYHLEQKDLKKLDSITNYTSYSYLRETHEFTVNNFDRIIYIIRKLLTEENYLKLDELAEIMYVSRSTLEKDLREAKKLLINFDLQLKSKPNYGMKVIGDEFNIRLAIAEFFFHHESQTDLFTEYKDNQTIDLIKKSVVNNSTLSGISLSDFSIKNIAIHIYILLIRNSKNKNITSYLNYTQFPISLEAKKTSRKIFNELQNIYFLNKISKNEINYLAVHLDSKQIIEKNNNINNSKIHRVINNIFEEINYIFKLDFSKDLTLQQFLIQHVSQMVKRKKYNLVLRNPFTYENMRKYLLAVKVTEVAISTIEKEYGIHIPLDEFGYLMLYFQTAINKTKKNRKINIVFIMGRGRSESFIYLNELKSQLSNELFNIKSLTNQSELNGLEDKIDIVVSTYSISTPNITYQVDIESGDYIKKIKKISKMITTKEVNIEQYFKPSFFIPNLKGSNETEVFNNIVKLLQKEEIIEEKNINKEPFASKEIGNEILHLHDLYKYCKKPVGFIGILDDPFVWDNSIVKVIILIKTKYEGDDDLPVVCDLLSNYFNQPLYVSELKENKDYNTFMKNLIGY